MSLFTEKKSSMEKEIFEQSKILSHLINTYINNENEIIVDVPADINLVIFVASGSSYNCARFAADLFGFIADMEARAIYSSEFLLKPAIPHSQTTLYVFITQSGETSDTNKALIKAKQFGIRTLCVTNNEDSTIWNSSDYKLSCHAGEEKSIAATKSFTAQMFCLTMMAFKYAQIKNVNIRHYIDDIKLLPQCIEQVYKLKNKIKCFAKYLSRFKNVIITADGISYSLAKEAALKIKETSYINVTASILGEFMHGHVAVLNNRALFIYLTVGELGYTASNNILKIKEDYNPPICLIGNPNNKLRTNFNINADCISEINKAFCIAVIIQMTALETAKKLRRNVDKPRGLRKVVK